MGQEGGGGVGRKEGLRKKSSEGREGWLEERKRVIRVRV